MRRNVVFFVGALLPAVCFPLEAQAQSPQTLWAFGQVQGDGLNPDAGLLANKAGVLFGTTQIGGNAPNHAGIVFSLTPPKGAQSGWSETILYSFGAGQDGGEPEGQLISDKSGNLYGITAAGGGAGCSGGGGCGTAFELAPNGAETVLYRFTGSTDGGVPMGGLVKEGGSLYGAATLGGQPGCGSFGCGVIFELVPPKNGATGWTESVLHAFGGDGANDGSTPYGALVAGSAGVLYGTTENGGIGFNNGTVFALTPPQLGQQGWTETILYSFAQGDVGCPQATLAEVSTGALYGTGKCGGATNNGGIFRLAPPTNGQTAWSYTLLYSFCSKANCADGQLPLYSGVTILGGKLYGTTYYGGSGHGVVYRLSPPPKGQTTWRETVLYKFPSAKSKNIFYPAAGVVANHGLLYGTTVSGGSPVDAGAVFSIAP